MKNRLFGPAAALLAGAGLAAAGSPSDPGAPATLPTVTLTVPAAAATPAPPAVAAPALSLNVAPVPDGGDSWFNAEFLVWWFKNSPVASPLAMTGPLAPDGTPFGVAPTIPGALGSPGTAVVLGNTGVDTGEHPGARFTLGTWLDPYHMVGVEGSYFFARTNSNTQAVNANGGRLLTVPFFDVGPALGENTFILAAPGSTLFAAGSASLQVYSRLQGAEANVLCNLSPEPGHRLDLVAGFRWLQLNEGLDFVAASAGVAPTAGVDVAADSFRTTNTFTGGQLGIRAHYDLGAFFVTATDKVGLGQMEQEVSINGRTATDFTAAGNGPLQTLAGGVFAQPTNMGTYRRTRVAIANELTVTAGCQVTHCASVFLGYNCLYVDRVARPGNQIDRAVNATQFQALIPPPGPLVGPARPTFAFNESSFWAQGVSVGLAVRY